MNDPQPPRESTCAKFRRELLIDPLSEDPAFTRHRSRCADCRQEAERLIGLEQRLRHAVEVDPPPGLESRVLRARRTREEKRRTRTHHLAMAASLLLVIGLAGWGGYRLHSRIAADALDQVVLDHIEHEIHHLGENHELRYAQVAPLFNQLGGDLMGDLGQVRYASKCPIREKTGVHMVLEGQHGPVTVLVMPGEHLVGELTVGSNRFIGVVVPTDYGSFAVVGEKGEPIDEVVTRIERKLVWKI